MYTTNPIHVLKQTGSLVNFKVNQSWKDGGSVSWVAVMHEDLSGELTCDKTESVLDETKDYTAVCEEGVAEVAVFVSDTSFEGLDDITLQIPASCGATGDDGKVMFFFSVPCNPLDESFCEEDALCPETPSPTFSPTALPSKVPTSSPTPVPTWESGNEDPVCVQEARLDSSTTDEGESGMYSANPIKVLSQAGSTVSFKVEQAFKDVGSVSWIAVMHEDSDGSMSCDKTDGVVDATAAYTATCNGGVAEVAVFVSDVTFDGLPDITGQIPGSCGVTGSVGDDDKVIFYFSVPCNPLDESFCDVLCPDTAAPTSTPTFAPTNSLTKVPTAAPTRIPGWPPSFLDGEPPCVQQARLDAASTGEGQAGMYNANPIQISDQRGSTVNIKVSQNWIEEGSLDSISVLYEDINGMECTRYNSFSAETDEYATVCNEAGVADIALFVSDHTFEGVTDITGQIPDNCGDMGSNTVMFYYSVPCNPKDETFCDEEALCPDTTAPTATPTMTPTASPSKEPTAGPTPVPTWAAGNEDPVCVQQARLDGDSTEEGKSGMYQTNPIQVVKQGGSTVRFKVDQAWKDTGSVSWISVMHENSDGELICPKSVDVVDGTEEYIAMCGDDGIAEVAVFVSDATFEGLQDITAQIPDTCDSTGNDGKAMFFFSVPCNPMDESFCEVLCPDTAAPTAAPTMTPTASPSKEPTAGPTPVPTWAAGNEDPVCVQQARLDGGSTEEGKSGMYQTNPIQVVKQGGSTVRFKVDQAWKDTGSVSWISVMHEDSEGELICPKSVDVVDGTEEYTAMCGDDGIAEVAVFVSDATFEGLPDITAQIPNTCDSTGNDGKAMFFFSVPCNPMDESFCEVLCPDTAAPTATPTMTPTASPSKEPTAGPTPVPTWAAGNEDPVCVQQARLDGGSTEEGKSGMYKTNPIRVVKQGGSTVHFKVDQAWKDTGSVSWISVMHEDSEGELICPKSVDVIDSTVEYTALCGEDGIAEVAVFVSDATFDGLQDISGQIPGSCGATGDDSKAMFFFSLPCDPMDETFCEVLCPETTAPTVSPTMSPTASPSKVPTAGPTSAPTWTEALEDPICVQEARLDGASTEESKTGMYATNPIKILKQGGATASFRIDQTWVEGTLDSMSVLYEDSEGEMVCPTTLAVAAGTEVYNAKCEDGVAEVAVFAADATFDGVKDITGQYPAICDVADGSKDKTVMFFFTFPCSPMDESFCEENALCPDTPSPTSSPTNFPTFSPTASPSKTPTASPTAAPTWTEALEDPICVQQARLDGASAEEGAKSMYTTNPISVVGQGGSTVNFKVVQTWLENGSLDAMSVMYEQAEGDMACPKTTAVTESTAVYSATCKEGIAEVAVFVSDATFGGVRDISGQLPTVCDVAAGSEDKTAMFFFSLPCSPKDEKFCEDYALCPDTPSPTASPTKLPTFSPTASPSKAPTDAPTLVPTWSAALDDAVCVQEALLEADSTEEGKNGLYSTNPIQIVDQEGSIVSFKVDQTFKEGGSVNWVSVFYQKSDGAKTCPQTTQLEGSTEEYRALCDNGVAEVALFVYDISFQNLQKDITGEIPDMCKPGTDPAQKVMFVFSVPCDKTDDDFCGENLCPDSEPDIAARDDRQDGFKLMENAVSCETKHVETFETAGEAESWEFGERYNGGTKFTSFMGRLGRENPMVAKTFSMPAATSATVELDFYDVDGKYEKNDRLLVGIQGVEKEIKLRQKKEQFHGQFSVVSSEKQKLDGKKNRLYHLKIVIDEKEWAGHGGKLSLSFKVVTTQSINQDSYGIDNVSIDVTGCGERRMRESGRESELGGGAEDGYYCKADDYPCGEGPTTVHVCHYSSRLGYQTFCIPEPDSELLRFYTNDYCGPCVGGFGGINLQ